MCVFSSVQILFHSIRCRLMYPPLWSWILYVEDHICKPHTTDHLMTYIPPRCKKKKNVPPSKAPRASSHLSICSKSKMVSSESALGLLGTVPLHLQTSSTILCCCFSDTSLVWSKSWAVSSSTLSWLLLSLCDSWARWVTSLLWGRALASAEYPCHQDQRQQELT